MWYFVIEINNTYRLPGVGTQEDIDTFMANLIYIQVAICEIFQHFICFLLYKRVVMLFICGY